MSSSMTARPSGFTNFIVAVAGASMLVIPLIGHIGWFFYAIHMTARRAQSRGMSWDLLWLWLGWPLIHNSLYIFMKGGLGGDAAGGVMFMQGVIAVCFVWYFNATTD